MSSSGSSDPKDRFFGALVYLLPLLDAFPFGQFLFQQIPLLAIIYAPIEPLLRIYYGVPFASIIIFFALFLGVVRNSRVSHFIRFNTMQAILMDILLFLFSIVLRLFQGALGGGLLTETMYNVIFLGTLFGCLYSMIQSARGYYAEIPTISEAANSQVRW